MPGYAWCDAHQIWQPETEFTPERDRPSGRRSTCTEALSAANSARLNRPDIHCPACDTDRPSQRFRGGRAKSATCKECEDARPDERWCVDCGWQSRANFTQTGRDGAYWATRCFPCRAAHSHGMTVADILRRQGSIRRECAACGSIEALKVDHDHGHCPTEQGCSECVRGYLCHQCNTAEGLLRTPERAMALALYMEEHVR